MLSVWVNKKPRTQQRRLPCSKLESQPSMAPQKRKPNPADNLENENQNEHQTSPNRPAGQLSLQETQSPDHTTEGPEASRSRQDELTHCSSKPWRSRRRFSPTNLPHRRRALQRANHLAEARCKLAAMQAEVAKLQQECTGTQASHENHSHTQQSRPLPKAKHLTFVQLPLPNLSARFSALTHRSLQLFGIYRGRWLQASSRSTMVQWTSHSSS